MFFWKHTDTLRLTELQGDKIKQPELLSLTTSLTRFKESKPDSQLGPIFRPDIIFSFSDIATAAETQTAVKQT